MVFSNSTDTSGLATNYNIYSNGTCIAGTVANFSTIDLADLIDESGTYSITVTAVSDGYEESEQSNAVEYVVKESVPTNLTGYTVTVDAGWTAEVGFYSQYGYDGTFEFATDGEHFETFSQIFIGFEPDFNDGGADGRSNYITLGNYTPSYGPFTNDVPLYFKNFTEEYATDSTLIQWFADNNATFKKTATTPTLISFTIENTANGDIDYQAVDGWTWADFVESEYNPEDGSNVMIDAAGVRAANGVGVIGNVQYQGVNVSDTEPIIANAIYTIYASTSGFD